MGLRKALAQPASESSEAGFFMCNHNRQNHHDGRHVHPANHNDQGDHNENDRVNHDYVNHRTHNFDNTMKGIFQA